MPTQSAKGRRSSVKGSATREQCWLRGQARKAERRKTQEAAFVRNRKLRTEGKPTPWQEAKIARFKRRHQIAAAT